MIIKIDTNALDHITLGDVKRAPMNLLRKVGSKLTPKPKAAKLTPDEQALVDELLAKVRGTQETDVNEMDDKYAGR